MVTGSLPSVRVEHGDAVGVPGGGPPGTPAADQLPASWPRCCPAPSWRPVLAADPRGHLPPEGTRADLAGHLVGAVEDEFGRLVGELRDRLRGLGRVELDVEVGPRGDPVADCAVLRRPVVRRRQELDQLLGRLVVLAEDAGEVTAAEHRLVLRRLAGHREDAHELSRSAMTSSGKPPCLRDEVALPVHVAARRVVEHRVGRGAEVVAGDRLTGRRWCARRRAAAPPSGPASRRPSGR